MNEIIASLKITSSPIINALIVILTFIIIAIIIDFLIRKVVTKITKKTKTDFDDKIIKIIHKPIFITIILSGTLYSLINIITEPNAKIITSNIFYTIISLVWMVSSIKLTNLFIAKAIIRIFDIAGLKKDILPLIEMITKITIIAISILIILSIWKIDIAPIIASAGIASIIIALAAKDTIANFLGGISVFLDKPFKIGDYIELDKGQRGEVVEIGVRSTRIKTRDDVLISIPNSIIANSQIINESAPIPQFRVRIPIGVAYGSDIDLVEKTLIELAIANENIVEEPSPRVRFRQFGESSLDFELLCWAKEPALRGLTIHQLNKLIYKKFAELNITIPFPQRDIHIHQVDKKEN